MQAYLATTQAVMTMLLAGFGGYIAWQQFRINREKHKLDLFDRRLAVFAGAR